MHFLHLFLYWTKWNTLVEYTHTPPTNKKKKKGGILKGTHKVQMEILNTLSIRIQSSSPSFLLLLENVFYFFLFGLVIKQSMIREKTHGVFFISVTTRLFSK